MDLDLEADSEPGAGSEGEGEEPPPSSQVSAVCVLHVCCVRYAWYASAGNSGRLCCSGSGCQGPLHQTNWMPKLSAPSPSLHPGRRSGASWARCCSASSASSGRQRSWRRRCGRPRPPRTPGGTLAAFSCARLLRCAALCMQESIAERHALQGRNETLTCGPVAITCVTMFLLLPCDHAFACRRELRGAAVAQAEVVACTLSAAGGELVGLMPPGVGFDALICDEAAQARRAGILFLQRLFHPARQHGCCCALLLSPPSSTLLCQEKRQARAGPQPLAAAAPCVAVQSGVAAARTASVLSSPLYLEAILIFPLAPLPVHARSPWSTTPTGPCLLLLPTPRLLLHRTLAQIPL